jgi:hypothetical protein
LDALGVSYLCYLPNDPFWIQSKEARKEITAVRKITLSVIVTLFCLTTFFSIPSQPSSVQASVNPAQIACLSACARELFQDLAACGQISDRRARQACVVQAARDAITCALACRD